MAQAGPSTCFQIRNGHITLHTGIYIYINKKLENKFTTFYYIRFNIILNI